MFGIADAISQSQANTKQGDNMRTYETLTSEKYWNESLKKEYKQLRRQKNRETVGNIAAFFVAVAMLSLVFYTYIHMQEWIEIFRQSV